MPERRRLLCREVFVVRSSLWSFLVGIPKNLALILIRCYQIAISPHFPGQCRFIPTCSQYGMIAIKRFGFVKGSYLTARRIVRCRPGGDYGYDPVPEEFPRGRN